MSLATPWLNFTTAISEGSGTLCREVGLSTGWLNPSNALAAGGGEASAPLGPQNTESVYLRVTGLQGAADALPENAIIEGIEVRVSRRFTRAAGTAVVRDCRAQIIKNGTLRQNKAKTGDWPLNVLADAIYGGETDKWGETWSRADIVSASFGFALKAYRTDALLTGNDTALVDHVQARIYYTFPSEMFLVF